MSIGSWSYEWAKRNQMYTEWIEQIPSTQSWAKESISFPPFSNKDSELQFEDLKIAEFEKIYFCESQSAGRGQGHHTWTTPDFGSSLLSTWVFNLKVAPPPYLTLRVGLALIRASFSTWPQLPWSLKAQNDLYLSDKKSAGLLLETISQGPNYKLLIGLGFNVNSSPNELASATCLRNLLNRDVNNTEWEHFLSRFYNELLILFRMSAEDSFKIREAQKYNEDFTNLIWAFASSEREALKFFINLNPASPKCIHINEKGELQWL